MTRFAVGAYLGAATWIALDPIPALLVFSALMGPIVYQAMIELFEEQHDRAIARRRWNVWELDARIRQ